MHAQRHGICTGNTDSMTDWSVGSRGIEYYKWYSTGKQKLGHVAPAAGHCKKFGFYFVENEATGGISARE